MGSLIGLIIVVSDIIAVIDLFKNIKDNAKKTLWLILIIVLPFLGTILYFLIGKDKK